MKLGKFARGLVNASADDPHLAAHQAKLPPKAAYEVLIRREAETRRALLAVMKAIGVEVDTATEPEPKEQKPAPEAKPFTNLLKSLGLRGQQ